jgi:hypothetical protein
LLARIRVHSFGVVINHHRHHWVLDEYLRSVPVVCRIDRERRQQNETSESQGLGLLHSKVPHFLGKLVQSNIESIIKDTPNDLEQRSLALNCAIVPRKFYAAPTYLFIAKPAATYVSTSSDATWQGYNGTHPMGTAYLAKFNLAVTVVGKEVVLAAKFRCLYFFLFSNKEKASPTA